MVQVNRTKPAPACLDRKTDYKCGTVPEHLEKDFRHKCYLCETYEPPSINVEHFIPTSHDPNKEFEWTNLFWVCSHCNNQKGNAYNISPETEVLDCTNLNHHVEPALTYKMQESGKILGGEVLITAVSDTNTRAQNTAKLLNKIYNSNAKLGRFNSKYIRNNLAEEIEKFQHLLDSYQKNINSEFQSSWKKRIDEALDRGTPFTAFKQQLWHDWQARHTNP